MFLYIGGIKGSKCATHSWQMNIGPQSGGFLPILKVKGRLNSSKRSQKRNRSAVAARSLDSATRHAGKISTANTASLLDLTTLSPSSVESKQRNGLGKLQREASLPVNLSLQISPTSTIEVPTVAASQSVPAVLKYSHDTSGVDNVLSKLDILDSSKQNGNVEQTTLTLREQLMMPCPPSTKSKSAGSAESSQDNLITKQELVTYNKNLTAAEQNNIKWKLDVTIPQNSQTGSVSKENKNEGSRLADLNNNTDDIIDSIKELNNPKSILKPKIDLDSSFSSEPSSKRAVGMSTYVLTPPMPPLARQASAAAGKSNKKRIIRARSATAQNLDSSLSNSPTNSMETENGDSSAANDSITSGGTSDVVKTVRFAEQPNNIKEYYPWEAPQHSLVHHTKPKLGKSHTFIL